MILGYGQSFFFFFFFLEAMDRIYFILQVKFITEGKCLAQEQKTYEKIQIEIQVSNSNVKIQSSSFV